MKQESGFTLLEVILSLVLVGILATVAGLSAEWGIDPRHVMARAAMVQDKVNMVATPPD